MQKGIDLYIPEPCAWEVRFCFYSFTCAVVQVIFFVITKYVGKGHIEVGKMKRGKGRKKEEIIISMPYSNHDTD